MLFSLLGLLLIAFFINEFLVRHTGIKQISPIEAVEWINHKEAIIFDIRSESLFSKGHILNALRLSIGSLEPNKGSLAKYSDKAIIVVSHNNYESSKVAKQLQEKGCMEVVVLTGGIPAWQAAGLPLVKL